MFVVIIITLIKKIFLNSPPEIYWQWRVVFQAITEKFESRTSMKFLYFSAFLHYENNKFSRKFQTEPRPHFLLFMKKKCFIRINEILPKETKFMCKNNKNKLNFFLYNIGYKIVVVYQFQNNSINDVKMLQ